MPRHNNNNKKCIPMKIKILSNTYPKNNFESGSNKNLIHKSILYGRYFSPNDFVTISNKLFYYFTGFSSIPHRCLR